MAASCTAQILVGDPVRIMYPAESSFTSASTGRDKGETNEDRMEP